MLAGQTSNARPGIAVALAAHRAFMPTGQWTSIKPAGRGELPLSGNSPRPVFDLVLTAPRSTSRSGGSECRSGGR